MEDVSLLFECIDDNDVKSLRELLTNGADPNAKWHGMPAIVKACTLWEDKNNMSGIVTALLDFGADIRDFKMEFTDLPFFHLIAGEYCDHKSSILSRMIKDGQDIDQKASDGSTALMCAALEEQGTNMMFLLESGADISINDNKGRSPLDYSIEKWGHLAVQELIIIHQPTNMKILDDKIGINESLITKYYTDFYAYVTLNLGLK